MSARQHLLNLAHWAVLSACTIGPGTLTSCAKVGAEQGVTLLWACLVAVLVTIVIQEATARLTIISGLDLGQAVRHREMKRRMQARESRILDPTSDETSSLLLAPEYVFSSPICYVIACASLLGNLAYEIGDFLGALVGVKLLIPGSWGWVVVNVVIALFIIALLFWGNSGSLSSALGFIVIGMSFCFLAAAFNVSGFGTTNDVVEGLFVPRLPSGSLLNTLAVIGTTAVALNVFLGSSLAAGQPLRMARIGITTAVILQGVLSASILIVGTSIELDDDEDFTLESLADALEDTLGSFALYAFALGLIAAGVSSAVAVPLTSTLTAKQLLRNCDTSLVHSRHVILDKPAAGDDHISADLVVSDGTDEQGWAQTQLKYRFVVVLTVVVGAGFGFLDLQPVPLIIIAQALNGMLLPFLCWFLLLALNDAELMHGRPNSLLLNTLAIVAVAAVSFLGFFTLIDIVDSEIVDWDDQDISLYAALVLMALFVGSLVVSIVRVRRSTHFEVRRF